MIYNYGKIIKSENLINKKAKVLIIQTLGKFRRLLLNIYSQKKKIQILTKTKTKIFIPRNLLERWNEDNVWFQETEEEKEPLKEIKISNFYPFCTI